MTLKAAKRGAIPPFIVMDVMRAAAALQAEGADVLHLEVGQPSTGAPRTVIAAAKQALDMDPLGYTSALGIAPLRHRLVDHYRDSYKVQLRPDNVVLTTGSSGAFLLAFLAAFAEGDRVGVAAPGYPAYRNILTALGIEAVLLPVGAETAFQPSIAMLQALPEKLDGLIVASPANPTGSMIGGPDLTALAAWCTQSGVRLVSDEIYHGLTYDVTASTVAGMDGVIVVNSFSKYFSMTGWRLGWMVVPDDLLRPIECLAQNLFISPPTLSQWAAIAAFDAEEELQANVARYRHNREILLDSLPAAGFPILSPPDGAFYLYTDVGRWTEDSLAFCKRMLHEVGVAATPGVDFDPARGHRCVRFSFSGATSDMVEAARRLKDWRK